MSKISITEKLESIGEIYSVRDKILESMPEPILFIKSKEELCFYVLNEFDFPVGTIQLNNAASLEAGCITILDLIGIDDDFETNLKIGSDTKFDTQLDRFLYYFLDFTGLPGVYKEQLELKVKSDLKTIL